MNNGTPKVMIEAIRNGMCIGPIKEADSTIRLHIRDFLAQKFSSACLLAKTDNELKLIQDLWFEITGEKL